MRIGLHSLILALSSGIWWLGLAACGVFAQKLGDPVEREVVYRIGSPLWTHSGVKALALSGDGTMIASIGLGEARVWDAANGKLLGVFPPPGNKDLAPTSWHFLPGGDGIVACWDNAAVLLDQKTLTVRQTFFAAGCAELSLCPKGEKMAVLRTDKGEPRRIDIVDRRSGKAVVGIELDVAELRGLQFSPDGQLLGGISAGGFLLLWDLRAPAKPRKLDLGSPWVVSYAFSPDVKRLAVTTSDGDLSLWDLRDLEKPAHRIKLPGAIEDASRFPVLFLDRQTLVTGDRGGSLRYWDLSARPLEEVRAYCGYVNALALAPDGKTLYSAGADGLIKRWDLRTRKEMAAIPGRLPGMVNAVAVNPSRNLLAVGSSTVVTLHDLTTGKERGRLGGFDFLVMHLTFAPDGRYLAASTGHEPSEAASLLVKVWDMETQKEVFSYGNKTPGGHAVPCLRLAGDRLVFLETSVRKEDGVVTESLQVWDWRQRKRISQVDLDCLAFQLDASPDGKSIAVAGLDSEIHLYDLANGQRSSSTRVINAENLELSAVFFRAKGKQLVSITRRGVVDIWNAKEGGLALELELDIKSPVSAYALSPSGQLLAVGGEHGLVSLWDLTSRQLVGESGLHNGSVKAIAFLDEERLVSAGADNTCVLSAPRSKERPGR